MDFTITFLSTSRQVLREVALLLNRMWHFQLISTMRPHNRIVHLHGFIRNNKCWSFKYSFFHFFLFTRAAVVAHGASTTTAASATLNSTVVDLPANTMLLLLPRITLARPVLSAIWSLILSPTTDLTWSTSLLVGSTDINLKKGWLWFKQGIQLRICLYF